MRLWHKDLIPVLPTKQLKGQWRECCAIASGIAENGTPGHLLVNKIMDYPLSHFVAYTKLVDAEMDRRGIGHRIGAFLQYFDFGDLIEKVSHDEIFKDWHNWDYAVVCQYNLYEKWTCGGLTNDEYSAICQRTAQILDEFLEECRRNGGISNE